MKIKKQYLLMATTISLGMVSLVAAEGADIAPGVSTTPKTSTFLERPASQIIQKRLTALLEKGRFFEIYKELKALPQPKGELMKAVYQLAMGCPTECSPEMLKKIIAKRKKTEQNPNIKERKRAVYKIAHIQYILSTPRASEKSKDEAVEHLRSLSLAGEGVASKYLLALHKLKTHKDFGEYLLWELAFPHGRKKRGHHQQALYMLHTLKQPKVPARIQEAALNVGHPLILHEKGMQLISKAASHKSDPESQKRVRQYLSEAGEYIPEALFNLYMYEEKNGQYFEALKSLVILCQRYVNDPIRSGGMQALRTLTNNNKEEKITNLFAFREEDEEGNEIKIQTLQQLLELKEAAKQLDLVGWLVKHSSFYPKPFMQLILRFFNLAEDTKAKADIIAYMFSEKLKNLNNYDDYLSSLWLDYVKCVKALSEKGDLASQEELEGVFKALCRWKFSRANFVSLKFALLQTLSIMSELIADKDVADSAGYFLSNFQEKPVRDLNWQQLKTVYQLLNTIKDNFERNELEHVQNLRESASKFIAPYENPHELFTSTERQCLGRNVLYLCEKNKVREQGVLLIKHLLHLDEESPLINFFMTLVLDRKKEANEFLPFIEGVLLNAELASKKMALPALGEEVEMFSDLTGHYALNISAIKDSRVDLIKGKESLDRQQSPVTNTAFQRIANKLIKRFYKLRASGVITDSMVFEWQLHDESKEDSFKRFMWRYRRFKNMKPDEPVDSTEWDHFWSENEKARAKRKKFFQTHQDTHKDLADAASLKEMFSYMKDPSRVELRRKAYKVMNEMLLKSDEDIAPTLGSWAFAGKHCPVRTEAEIEGLYTMHLFETLGVRRDPSLKVSLKVALVLEKLRKQLLSSLVEDTEVEPLHQRRYLENKFGKELGIIGAEHKGSDIHKRVIRKEYKDMTRNDVDFSIREKYTVTKIVDAVHQALLSEEIKYDDLEKVVKAGPRETIYGKTIHDEETLKKYFQNDENDVPRPTRKLAISLLLCLGYISPSARADDRPHQEAGSAILSVSHKEKVGTRDERGGEAKRRKIETVSMEQAEDEAFVNILASSPEPEEQTGPWNVPGWELENNSGGGNCFYMAVADQLQQMRHPFLSDEKTTDALSTRGILHDYLRLKTEGAGYIKGEWTDDSKFKSFLKGFEYPIVLAVADTRHPDSGFTAYYLGEGGDLIVERGDTPLPQSRPVIKLACSNDHFLSVRYHPRLDVGAVK